MPFLDFQAGAKSCWMADHHYDIHVKGAKEPLCREKSEGILHERPAVIQSVVEEESFMPDAFGYIAHGFCSFEIVG